MPLSQQHLQTPAYQQFGQVEVATELANFVEHQLATSASSGLSSEQFWQHFATVAEQFKPSIETCRLERDIMQTKIDSWLLNNGTKPVEAETFLRSIGYLVDAPSSVQVTTANVDPEIALLAGPQLVVPLDNARYALNAANARWGSLYDAFYGTDALDADVLTKSTTHTSAANTTNEQATQARSASSPINPDGYNPERGQRVIALVRELLDTHFPLAQGSHKDAVAYAIAAGSLTVSLENGAITSLADPAQFIGYNGDELAPRAVFLQKHGLGLELLIDPNHNIGKTDKAHIADVKLESALSTIMDLEDSVSAVDAQDKAAAYGNWLGLIQGNLKASFTKGTKTLTRSLQPNTTIVGQNGQQLQIKRRSIMLLRCVGLHMDTNMVRYDGHAVPETIIDVAIAAWCAAGDLNSHQNSATGSIYIVLPKLHGPQEVALARDLLAAVENLLCLPVNTIKMGIMDEERRTSVNLAACIAQASERVVFINTGFLDRTGDDIHTNNEAGPVLPKAELKSAEWLNAYENANVAVGLKMGLVGHAQIGKGMWARPDDMAAMLAQKRSHPLSGASTAWVPSPTAATLHALHYLEIDVRSRQAELLEVPHDYHDGLLAMLTPAVIPSERKLSSAEIQRELNNNVQGILGYVARWVGQGVGCSKVPDIDNVALMEDRATLRISSQHIANWLHHGLVNKEQVIQTMQQMASVVDAQNAGDPGYQAMSANLDRSNAFQAALRLVMNGRAQPNGYTESILTTYRRQQKHTNSYS